MMMTNKRLYATGAALLLALALGACGGSDNSDNGGGTPAVSAGASDSFFAQVRALIANSPDNTEPVAVDTVVVTAPENIEPAPL